MPVRRTIEGVRPAYQWGKTGAKYAHTPGNKSRESAKAKAVKQGRAVQARRLE